VYSLRHDRATSTHTNAHAKLLDVAIDFPQIVDHKANCCALCNAVVRFVLMWAKVLSPSQDLLQLLQPFHVLLQHAEQLLQAGVIQLQSAASLLAQSST